MTAVPKIRRRRALTVVGALIALKLALLIAFALNGRFVMDEFEQLGWAKYFGHGLFQTIWPAKAVGYAAFFDLAHLAGWDARSILIAGRLEAAALACGTIAMVYAIARALGQDRLRALVAVLALLAFTNFIERSYRTIAEPVALFFATAALLAVVRGRADDRARILAAGALSGLSFLCTQKALYFNAALGLALVGDALVRRQIANAVRRGAWLVLGWVIPVVAYCLIFGRTDPLALARNLILGPTVIAGRGGGDYGGLRVFVVATLKQNAFLYLFSLAGMALVALRFRRLEDGQRIALLFTVVIAMLVFSHDQPWPYVFIMAQPFMALWVTDPIVPLSGNRPYLRLAASLLVFGIAISFVRNAMYLRWDNHTQLALVDRAEALIGPDDIYFDGIGMLPNRREPSTLWLDRHYVIKTLREGRSSEAYRIFADTPPKLIIWSYRMDDISEVLAPRIRGSYVQIAPNLRIAGRRLQPGRQQVFDVPLAGTYALYSDTGSLLEGQLAIDGHIVASPIDLGRGPKAVTLHTGSQDALLLPEGSYAGQISSGPDDPSLFAGVYN